MEAVLLVIHLIVALGIIIMVLLQPAESGGFLGQGGSMSNMLAPRRSGDVMTRMTGIFAALFFVTSLSLAFIATKSSPRHSILDEVDAPATAIEQPAADATPTAPVAGAEEQPAATSEEAAPVSDGDAAAVPAAEEQEPTAPIAQ